MTGPEEDIDNERQGADLKKKIKSLAAGSQTAAVTPLASSETGPGVNISKCWKPAGTYAESFINANSPTCAEHRRSQQSGANSTQGQIELSLLSLPSVKIKILALDKELLHMYACNSGSLDHMLENIVTLST